MIAHKSEVITDVEYKVENNENVEGKESGKETIHESQEEEYVEMYYVVKNHEEQYSIWPSYKPIPPGWEAEKEPQPKEPCLAYIEKVWTDMRPLSLRIKMAELERKEEAKKKAKGKNKEKTAKVKAHKTTTKKVSPKKAKTATKKRKQ